MKNGISSEVVDFFAEFLHRRKFIAAGAMGSVAGGGDLLHNPHHSINCGVLQGSISGPILFSLFIDEVLRGVSGTVASADDLALAVGLEDVAKLQFRLGAKFN